MPERRFATSVGQYTREDVMPCDSLMKKSVLGISKKLIEKHEREEHNICREGAVKDCIVCSAIVFLQRQKYVSMFEETFQHIFSQYARIAQRDGLHMLLEEEEPAILASDMANHAENYWMKKTGVYENISLTPEELLRYDEMHLYLIQKLGLSCKEDKELLETILWDDKSSC